MPAPSPEYKLMKPSCLQVFEKKLGKLSCFPGFCRLAKFMRTEQVFTGWMINHPNIPPRPEVENETHPGNAAGFALIPAAVKLADRG
mmetsp:Transcript_118214/g.235489  ORF Transcript_118214/g.235489 Transcript_118214/m.235489 type:complete len:87 (+) Transcript_118214:789-1049(+)